MLHDVVILFWVMLHDVVILFESCYMMLLFCLSHATICFCSICVVLILAFVIYVIALCHATWWCYSAWVMLQCFCSLCVVLKFAFVIYVIVLCHATWCCYSVLSHATMFLLSLCRLNIGLCYICNSFVSCYMMLLFCFESCYNVFALFMSS